MCENKAWSPLSATSLSQYVQEKVQKTIAHNITATPG
jgi:hypothetical protein